jgi:hypothetical protein
MRTLRRLARFPEWVFFNLVWRGYLDPNNRGDRADECEAIETFLMDSLAKAT